MHAPVWPKRLSREREIFLSFQVKSWGKNKLTIGREGFAVPEHFPTFKIFFPRLEGPFRRVASLAENFHPLLWIEPFIRVTVLGLLGLL